MGFIRTGYTGRPLGDGVQQTGFGEHLRRSSLPTRAGGVQQPRSTIGDVQQLPQAFGERPLRRRGGKPQPLPTAVLFGVNYSCRLSMLLHRCCLTDAYRMPRRSQPVCGQPAGYDCSKRTATAPSGTLSLQGSSVPTGATPQRGYPAGVLRQHGTAGPPGLPHDRGVRRDGSGRHGWKPALFTAPAGNSPLS